MVVGHIVVCMAGMVDMVDMVGKVDMVEVGILEHMDYNLVC